MAKIVREIGRYIAADFRTSVEVWHKSRAMGTLIGAVIAFAITLLGLWGIRVEFDLPLSFSSTEI